MTTNDWHIHRILSVFKNDLSWKQMDSIGALIWWQVGRYWDFLFNVYNDVSTCQVLVRPSFFIFYLFLLPNGNGLFSNSFPWKNKQQADSFFCLSFFSLRGTLYLHDIVILFPICPQQFLETYNIILTFLKQYSYYLNLVIILMFFDNRNVISLPLFFKIKNSFQDI